MPTSTIDVVLPTLNEEGALPYVLGRMPPNCRPIVVDNGSSDQTAAVARELGAIVISEPKRGFGAACFAGLMAAEAQFVAFMDADASFDPRELFRVIDPVQNGEADLMLGARNPLPGSWPFHARMANRALSRILSHKSGLHLRDLGPMRACRRLPLIDLGIEDRRSGWPLEMVLRAQANGWRIKETLVSYSPRVGKSKVTGTFRGTVRAVQDMTRVMREVKSQ